MSSLFILSQQDNFLLGVTLNSEIIVEPMR